MGRLTEIVVAARSRISFPQVQAFTAGAYHVINRAILRIAKCFFDRRSRDGCGLGSGTHLRTVRIHSGFTTRNIRAKALQSRNADRSLISPRMSGKTLGAANVYLLPMTWMAG